MIIQHAILCCSRKLLRDPVHKDFLVSFFNLFLLFLLTLVFTTLGGLGLLAADTSRTATTEGRGESEVNVLLGVETDHEGWNVDDLLADTIPLLVRYTCELNSDKNIPDVTLADQDTGVVDRLGKTELVDTGLETTLQEILNLQGQDVIELHAGLVEHTDTNQTTNQGITFEETLGVLLVESKKLTKKEHQSDHPPQQFNGKSDIHTEQHDESWKG
jgi:hypothetical protein